MRCERINWSLMHVQLYRLFTFIGLNTHLDIFDLSRDGFVYCESVGGNFFICCYCKASYPCSERPNHTCPWKKTNIPIAENELSFLQYSFDQMNAAMLNSVPDYIIRNNPKHRDMAIEQTRLSTMNNKPSWDRNHIANAGFFFKFLRSTKTVCVVCFYCNCRLYSNQLIKKLGKNIDARILHVLHNPNCDFLIQTMGQGFIDTITQLPIKVPSTLSLDNIVEKMRERNQIIPQKKQAENIKCKICLEYEANVVFLPCGHIIACLDCTFALTHCCVCRIEIKSLTRCFAT